MKMRRMFAALLVAALLLSVLPVVGFGITTTDIDTKGDTTGPYDNSELYLSKTATLEDDGTYTIRLEAFATGNPVTTQIRTGKPLDIVLVLDQSGSMFNNNYLETLRTSVGEFIGVIAANGRTIGVTHRVAIVGFASDIDDGSSMNADNKDHQIAGGSDNVYTNTGVFLEDGTFKNYGTLTESYIEFNGTPVKGGSYFVRDNDNVDDDSAVDYFPLTEGVGYAVVENPAIDRTDLYALHNGNYVSAHYVPGGYTEVAQSNMQSNGTYYIDVDGVKTKLTYITVNTDTVEAYEAVDEISGTDGQVYYLDLDGGNDGPWTKVTYKRTSQRDGFFTYYTHYFEDSAGNEYPTNEHTGIITRATTFTYNGQSLTPYTKTTTTGTKSGWSVDNTNLLDLTGKTVYQLSDAGWYYTVNGVENKAETLYEANALTWSYDGTTYDPATSQFFVVGPTGGLSNDDYRDALMPVTDGEAGAGNTTAALNTAVSKIASSGATRTSLGMEMAKNILANRTRLGDDDNRETVVVVFTDGTPGFRGFEDEEANAALTAASTIKKDDADIYTIGLYSSADTDVTNFMNYLSSNYGAVENMSRQSFTYSEAENVSTPSFNYSNTANSNCFALYEGTYYPVYVKRSDSSNARVYSWYFTDVNGETHEICNEQAYNGTEQLYTRTSTTLSAEREGYYLFSSDKDKLHDIFPEIITDSTTTTLDQKWLYEDAILRDILQTGFVFTNGTTVTMSSLSGTWSNSNIKWADSETTISSVTVKDPSAAKTTSADGKLSVYNQGGVLSVEATGFDYNANYFSQGGKENGAKLIVTISRVEATDLVTWNQTELTNNPDSGVWSSILENGTRAQIGVFPQPTTYFTNTAVVMDYAKTTEDIAALLRQKGAEHLDATGMHYFTSNNSAFAGKYGDAAISGGKLTYSPKTMKWDGYDAFYVFGNTEDAKIVASTANANGNVWSKVTVIPANNVYYEDTFIEVGTDGEKPTWSNVIVGIEYSGDWTNAAGPGDNTETPENGENAEEDNQGGVHGWEDSLADDKGYSDGTAAVGGNGATATFTFTGTGVDIYSRTNMDTGLIMASLYAGNAATGTPLRTLVIDNFAHSGDYYMIPTLSIHQMVKRVNGVTQKDENGNIQYVDMPHGTYTVKLTVIAVTDDATAEARSTYYLDGIRVYNPVAVDSTVKDAYGDDELNATFTEVRDILLDAKNFWDSGEGPVFIDQIPGENGNTTTDIGVYKDLGPENEVYLSKNQVIVFAPDKGAKYYVGLKSPTGEPVDVVLTTAAGPTTVTISHTTDLYYEVAPYNGMITLGNNEDADLLAITKIKVTSPDTVMKAMFRTVSREEVLSAAGEAYAAANEPETPDVEIENPEVEEPTPDPSEQIRELIKRLFENLWGWFH